MIPQLLPNTQTPKSECYKLAWGALVNTPSSYSPEHRAHAKCWLTYRAVDGEITLADWLLKIDSQEIQPIKDAKCALRWKVSQATAEAYLMILTRQTWQPHARRAWEPMASGGLDVWPGGATNAMRACALLAYADMVTGDFDAAKSTALAGIAAWLQMWASFSLDSNPMRFAELGQDAGPLWALTRIAKPELAPEPWADALVAQAAGPWGRAMAEIGKQKSRLW